MNDLYDKERTLQEIAVCKAAIEYLNENGLIVTAHFSEEHPPSKEIEEVLLRYMDEAADNCSLDAEEYAIEMIQGDIADLEEVWSEDSEDERKGLAESRRREAEGE